MKTKRPRHFDYDLIVVGSGSGGGVAAHMSARLGKKVAIIEPNVIGGECPNFGCVPTKALLMAAETYKNAKNASDFGIRTTGVSFNYKSVKAWKDQAVHNTGTFDGVRAFKNAGVEVIKGHGHFLDKWTISTGKKRYTAKKFLIATGTYNLKPKIEGLAETGYITYKEAIDLEKPLRSVFIIGGGAIGCEFAQIMSTFGTKVQIAEFGGRLVPKEDEEVGHLVEHVFTEEGIKVHVATEVTKVTSKSGRKEVTYLKNGETKKTLVDEILLAAGKGVMTDIGLENAEVQYDRRRIITNSLMQTSNPNIYAAGDVAGPFMFTHMAGYQSRIAAHNMWHRTKKQADYRAVPRCIFVEPEAASVGMTEDELRADKIPFQKATVPISSVGKSNTSQRRTGFVKVLASHTGLILGASVVSPRAGEVIHELTLAVQKGLKASDIEETIHAYPTWSQAVHAACSRITCV